MQGHRTPSIWKKKGNFSAKHNETRFAWGLIFIEACFLIQQICKLSKTKGASICLLSTSCRLWSHSPRKARQLLALLCDYLPLLRSAFPLICSVFHSLLYRKSLPCQIGWIYLKHYGRCLVVGNGWRSKEVIWTSRSSPWNGNKKLLRLPSIRRVWCRAGGSSICGGIRGGVALVECWRGFCYSEKGLRSTVIEKIPFPEMDFRLWSFSSSLWSPENQKI